MAKVARSAKSRRISLLVEGAIVMMCVLCVLITFAYNNFRDLENASRLNLHTSAVLDKVVVLRSTMVDCESRLRGFALTSDPIFIHELGESKELADSAMNRLQSLTSDNPGQQQRVKEISAKFTVWKQRFTRIPVINSVSAREVGMITPVRRAELIKIRELLNKVEANERVLLRERSWHQESTQRSAARFLLIASICALSFTLLFIVLLATQIRAVQGANRALLASQQQLKTILEHAPLVLYSVDLNEKFTLMTGRSASGIGLSPEKSVGKTLAESMGSDYNFEPIRAALKGQANTSRTEYGGVVFETTRAPLTNEQGDIIGMIGVGLDVTDSVRSENALRESEARFRSVIESVQEVVFQVDDQGRWSFLNPAWRLVLGHSMDESLGESAMDFIAPGDQEEIRAFFSDAQGKPKELKRGLIRFRTRAGSYRWMDMLMHVHRDEKGHFIGASGTFSDINDRKLAQEELLATTTLQKAILNSSNYSIIAVNADGIIESFNRAAQVLLGYSADEVSGKRSIILFHDQNELMTRTEELAAESGRTLTPLDALVFKAKGGFSDEREWTYVSRDGARVPMRISVSGLRGVEGETSGFVMVGYDLTETRRAESLKNEFVSVVSHELRTPLTSIRGALGLLAGGVAGEMPAGAKQMLDIASKNSDRLVLLINDILDIEKIENGEMRFEKRDLEIGALLRSAVEQNQVYGQALNVELVLDGNAGQGQHVSGDEHRLQQVLSNLISNACKFTPSGGKVHISSTLRGSYIRVSVRDEGPGVPEEFIPRLFDKFTQADSSSTRKQGGTGLGLAIAKAIIEKHGGVLRYISPEGDETGACFAFDLPLILAVIETASVSGQGKVLICEDEPDVAELLSFMVINSGYTPDIACTLAEARHKLETEQYAGVTLDLMFPDGDGLDMLAEIRENPRLRELPVIVVSLNSGSGELRGDAFDVVDWLRKPIDAGRLLAALDQFHNGTRPRVLHVEDDADVRRIMEAILASSAIITPASTLREAHARLEEAVQKGLPFDLAILDTGLPDGSGFELVSTLTSTHPPIPIIMFSASEASSEEARLVTAALVKSRTTNEVLRDTIQRLLHSHGKSPDSLA